MIDIVPLKGKTKIVYYFYVNIRFLLKKLIPNLITLLNLLSGCIATIFAVNDQLVAAAMFVFLGIFFDFFDGFLARKLNVQSDIGVQLDSLADMVTSGLVPGIIMYKLLAIAFSVEWNSDLDPILSLTFDKDLIPMLGLLITLASAYRLAKFNVSSEQSDHFIGLPTPGNAILIVSLPLILEYQSDSFLFDLILNKWLLGGLTLISCYLLNSKLKFLSFKFKSWAFKENKYRYFLIILSIGLLVTLKFTAIPLIVLIYLSTALLTHK